MTSVRLVFTLIGTAIMGRLSDSNGLLLAQTLVSLGKADNSKIDSVVNGYTCPNGRQACLHIGTIASLAGLAITASMNSLQGLWINMIPGALLQHNCEV